MRRITLFLSLLLLPSLNAFAAARVELSYRTISGFHMPGADLAFELVVYNIGPDVAQNVVLTAPVPPGTQLKSASVPPGWTCTLSGDAVTCRIAQLPVTVPGRDYNVIRLVVTFGTSASGVFDYEGTLEAENSPRRTFELRYAIFSVVTVTTRADSGPGSLREAILQVNGNRPGDPWRVVFDLPEGSVFEPLTPLPAITACGVVRMDAIDVRGREEWSTRQPPYELSGARVSSGSGLQIRAHCTEGGRAFELSGLAIGRFPENGVDIHPSGSAYRVTLERVFIGTDVTGTIPRPNGSRGIAITSPVAQVGIGNAVVSGNARSGVWAWDSQQVAIAASKIGVGADGRPMGNGATGAFVLRGRLRISGTTVAHNAHWGASAFPGAFMDASAQNSFHSNGVLGIDWGVDLQTLEATRTSPAAPVITSATYDPAANATIVRGTIARDPALPGDRYSFHVYSSAGVNGRGFVEGERWEGHADVYCCVPNQPATLEWTVILQGQRNLSGRFLTAVAGIGWSGSDIYSASEFSLPFTVD